MLTAYGLREGRLAVLSQDPTCRGLDPREVVWVDLLDPSSEEEKAVEALLGFGVPTREEMVEIEESSRLYAESGALVMTTVLLTGASQHRPTRSQATFVLNPDHLVTVRYVDPPTFKNFAARALAAEAADRSPAAPSLLIGLLESITDRVADVLEAVAGELNAIATELFLDDAEKGPAETETVLRAVVRRLGRKNITLAILRESLLSLQRLSPFLRQGAADFLPADGPARLKQLDRDLRSLADYEAQMSAEIVYLHDATLGFINLDQNRIIKVFSIASVLFLPPTLVGTVYGMNFDVMPELHARFGYPLALLAMVVSALLPLWWFKRRGWL